jgi:hypothetical protein
MAESSTSFMSQDCNATYEFIESLNGRPLLSAMHTNTTAFPAKISVNGQSIPEAPGRRFAIRRLVKLG